MHAGKRSADAMAEGAIKMEVRQWMLDGHDGTDVNPAATLLQLIAFWKFKTNFYGKLLGEAYVAAERLQQAHAADAIVLEEYDPDADVPESPDRQVARMDLHRIFNVGGVAALIGHRYDADRNGRVYAVEEGIRALVRLEGEASDRVAKYCALAIQAKASASLVALYQQLGGQLVAVLAAILTRLGVSLDSPEVMTVVAEEIGVLAGGAETVRVSR